MTPYGRILSSVDCVIHKYTIIPHRIVPCLSWVNANAGVNVRHLASEASNVVSIGIPVDVTVNFFPVRS